EHVHPPGIHQPLKGAVDGGQPHGVSQAGMELLCRKGLRGAPQGLEHGRALPGDARRLGNSAVDHEGPESTPPAICQNRAVSAVPPGAYGRYALVYDLVWRAAPYGRFADLCLEAAADQGTGVRRVLVAACGTGSTA